MKVKLQDIKTPNEVDLKIPLLLPKHILSSNYRKGFLLYCLMREYNNLTYKSGLIDKTQFEVWLKMYPNYNKDWYYDALNEGERANLFRKQVVKHIKDNKTIRSKSYILVSIKKLLETYEIDPEEKFNSIFIPVREIKSNKHFDSLLFDACKSQLQGEKITLKISRTKLEENTGVSKKKQRRLEKRIKTKKKENFAEIKLDKYDQKTVDFMKSENSNVLVLSHKGERKVVKQLPNTYKSILRKAKSKTRPGLLFSKVDKPKIRKQKIFCKSSDEAEKLFRRETKDSIKDSSCSTPSERYYFHEEGSSYNLWKSYK